jgi:uncharacterized protein YgfB (UPF0149 family)
LPENLGLEADSPAEDPVELADARRQISSLQEQSADALSDPDLGFSLLLPFDEEALGLRVDALAQWCQGFLYGLSTQPAVDLNHASAELREVVKDLVEISRAGVVSAQEQEEEGAEPDEEEADETAYAELTEYVRAAAQWVFLEMRPRLTGGTGATGSAALH